ncbi:CD3324 family protein [Clostridium boliviensis]|uniref:CD3324 family protein n=1 Tax=Clostridium boliviensis TaxID=318465 RepID=A0ABU4GST2_9CLOT|nr:CD3324 family protein [Clostridium boliviensis]MDW2800706.1 CD3324 family protein [Clostridium boliviensis]
MKYVNAKTILPDKLVRELQQYIQGEYVYIPALNEQRKQWGEKSGYREELKQRNNRIRVQYYNGSSMDVLADQYCLSLSAIRKIIYQS